MGRPLRKAACDAPAGFVDGPMLGLRKEVENEWGERDGPIEAANLFADLSELCEKHGDGEEGCP